MKLITHICALLLFLPAIAVAGPIQSITFSGPLTTCSLKGSWVITTWTNNLNRPIYVTDGYVWVGEDGGGRSDTAIWLLDKSSGVVFDNTNWDHYAEPTSIQANQLVFNVAPNYFLVNPNDVIVLQQSCAGPYAGTKPVHIATEVLLHYLTSAPN